jgi:hypothetical protein
MRRALLSILGLSLLLFALDQLFRVLHPQVNLVRASLVGLSALIALAALARLLRSGIRPWVGALSILASAFSSVLLIEAGALVSRSLSSALVHVAILAVAYPLLDRASLSAGVGRELGAGLVSERPRRDGAALPAAARRDSRWTPTTTSRGPRRAPR